VFKNSGIPRAKSKAWFLSLLEQKWGNKVDFARSIRLEEYAKNHLELKQALKKWGRARPV